MAGNLYPPITTKGQSDMAHIGPYEQGTNSGLTCGISQSVDADGRSHQVILIVEATLGTPLLSIAKSM